jgi:hypothetical protein
MRLLKDAHFAVERNYWIVAMKSAVAGMINSILHRIQHALYHKKALPLATDPIFIIGHWRSGTTFLHNLMCLDPNHTAPNTYECLFPNHFLLTESLAHRLINRHEGERCNDNMPVSLWGPQEDEIALANLGVPSPYLSALFPNQLDLYNDYYAIGQLPTIARQKWSTTFTTFLNQVSLKRKKQLVLKNPAHSFRIAHLLELYPESKFIHIVRNPHDVFRSTNDSLKAMHQSQGFHSPTFATLHDFIFDRYTALQTAILRDKKNIHPSRYIELRYEDLIQNPTAQLEKIYRHFHLPNVESIAGRIIPFMKNNPRRDAQKNLSPELRQDVSMRWGTHIEHYGYNEEKA